MKVQRLRLIQLTLVLAFLCASNSHGQGTFQNLDFEASTVPQTQAPGPVSVTIALPGWTVLAGSNQLNQVLFNAATLGTTSVSLIGTTGVGTTKSIEGGFSVLLQGYTTAPGASISQTAVVPAITQSIRFKAEPDVVPGIILVSLGGQNIPIFNLGTGPNYTLYGGDIPPAFAGQLEQLQFSAPESFSGPNDWNIDSIIFSPNAIPEPGTCGLLLWGAVGLLAVSRWKRKE